MIKLKRQIKILEKTIEAQLDDLHNQSAALKKNIDTVKSVFLVSSAFFIGIWIVRVPAKKVISYFKKHMSLLLPLILKIS